MDIVTSIARTLFVNAWANKEEEKGRSHGGQELFDIAPKTSRAAQDDAWRLVGMIEALNGMNIWAISARVLKGANLPDNEKNQEKLGHYLAMEALGHGVSWMDDHDDHGLKVPDFEFHV